MKYEIKPAIKVKKINYLGECDYTETPVKTFDGERQLQMSIVSPDVPFGKDERFPCILWIPGGAWLAAGQKKWLTEFAPFAHEGYVVAAATYRCSTEAIFPAQIEDLLTAIRFLREYADQLHIDPDHIGVMGCSAGGHLTALLAMNPDVFGKVDYPKQSSHIQAAVDLFGPVDVVSMWEKSISQPRPPMPPMPFGEPGEKRCLFPMPPFPKGDLFPEERLIGGPMQENLDKAARTNPINYISDAVCPMLIMHGTDDPEVPCNESIKLYEALISAGKVADLAIIPGAGHGTAEFSQPEIKEIILEFFGRYL